MPERGRLGITDEQKGIILDGAKAGLSRHELAKKSNTSISTVSKYLRTFGVRPRTRYTVATERREKVRELKAGGFEAKEIAAKLGVPVGTIYNDLYVRKSGNSTARNRKWRTGKAAASANGHRRFKPIVLNMDTVEQEDGKRLGNVLDVLWAKLRTDEKLRAMESLKEGQ